MLAWLVACGPANAHSASSSYLTLAASGRDIQVQWEIALRDLDFAIGLDTNGDGDITWGELRRHAQAITAYALPRLTLQAAGAACPPGPVALLSDLRGDGAYAVLRFTARCPRGADRLHVHYALMFDLDAQHRGLLNYVNGGASRVAALSPAAPDVTFTVGTRLGATFAEFFRVGVAHIFSGPDHLLFVAVLLFPAMFRRRRAEGWRPGRWQPVATFRPAFLETLRILSAFTLAHAITVTAATLGWIDIPSRIIEGAIALTIAATAIDNIYPVLPERRWLLAFAFGLVHGMGFAAALGPLSLPALALAVALLAFNTGVEAAQLCVAVVVLPVGFLARNVRAYPLVVLPGASVVAALLALAWFADRTLSVRVF